VLFLAAFGCRGAGFRKGLLEIGNNVVDVFSAHRDTNQVFCDARVKTLLFGELFVSSVPGVDGERLRITDAAKGSDAPHKIKSK
jgi:hypothetical protein